MLWCRSLASGFLLLITVRELELSRKILLVIPTLLGLLWYESSYS